MALCRSAAGQHSMADHVIVDLGWFGSNVIGGAASNGSSRSIVLSSTSATSLTVASKLKERVGWLTFHGLVLFASGALDIPPACRHMRLMPIFDKAFRDFAAGTSIESNSNSRMPEVSPLANVPSSDLTRLREAIQDRRETTDAKNAVRGNDNFAFLRVRHWPGFSNMCPCVDPGPVCQFD